MTAKQTNLLQWIFRVSISDLPGINNKMGRKFAGLRSSPNRRSLSVLLLVPMVLCVWSEIVWAQTTLHRDWEVSVFAGGSFIGDSVHQTPVEAQSSGRAVGLSYGTGLQMGIRVTDNEWEHWGASFEYSFTNQPVNFTNLSESVPSLGLGHAIHRWAYDVLYYPYDRDYKLRPFVFGGPGVSLFYIESSGKDAAAAQGIRLNDPWKFTVHWGGGLKYQLEKQVAASFHFADYVSGVPGYGLPTQGRVESGTFIPGFRPDGLLNNWVVGIDLMFQWKE